MTEEKTTIQITTEAREKLRQYGNKGQTYTEVIEDLLKEVEE